MKKTKHKRRIKTTLMVLMLAMVAIGGMIAYLTDRDSDINVFTIGNVYVDLIEDFEQGAELLPGRDIKKEATIQNIGKSDAWVWMTVAVPSALDNAAANKVVLHCCFANDVAWDVNNTVPMTMATINNVEYNVYTLLHKETLKPDEITAPGLYKVYLDDKVDVVDGKYYWVDGNNMTYIDYDVAEATVIVSVYAIQNEGFDSVKMAYDAYHTQWDDKGR